MVAGASEGLGQAFAASLASRGVNLLLLARRAAVLETVAEEIRSAHSVEVEVRAVDLAEPGLAEALRDLIADRPVGLGVYNAAYAPLGALLDQPLDGLLRAVDVNVRGPVTLARILGPAMVERGSGGLIFMSSLAGFQGSPRLATYAATKAFNTVFGESLWGELRDAGVDVLVSCAGAIRTPGYLATSHAGDPPGTLDPDAVAERTLKALGKGPRVVPGVVNQLASLFMGRLLPRRTAISIMASNTGKLKQS
ncbi:MAG: SDR family NAD(P)-dependent oxidoreductase [Myxococcota bacterium]